MANRNFPSQRLFSFQGAAVMLQASAVIDSGQTSDTVNYKVRSVKGSGISYIRNVGTGLYKIGLEDTYARALCGAAGFVSGVDTPIHIHDASSSTLYIITSLGTTSQAQWVAAGLDPNITAAVGVAFVTGSGSMSGITGTGTVAIAKSSGIAAVEIVGNANLTLADLADPHFFIATMGSSVTMNSYTPAGSNSAPALTMDSYTPAGTNANDGPPETFTGTPAVLTGSVAAPSFTGTPAVLTGSVSLAPVAPLDNSVLGLQIMLRNSSLKEKGE